MNGASATVAVRIVTDMRGMGTIAFMDRAPLREAYDQIGYPLNAASIRPSESPMSLGALLYDNSSAPASDVASPKNSWIWLNVSRLMVSPVYSTSSNRAVHFVGSEL